MYSMVVSCGLNLFILRSKYTRRGIPSLFAISTIPIAKRIQLKAAEAAKTSLWSHRVKQLTVVWSKTCTYPFGHVIRFFGVSNETGSPLRHPPSRNPKLHNWPASRGGHIESRRHSLTLGLTPIMTRERERRAFACCTLYRERENERRFTVRGSSWMHYYCAPAAKDQSAAGSLVGGARSIPPP